MSDWAECKLGEISGVQTGPFGSQLHAADYVDFGVPSIMPKNIGQRLDISLDSIAYITEEDAKRLQKYRVKPNDIVFSRRGDVEKCAFITDEMDGWLCGTGCLKVDFFSDAPVIPQFMAYYFSTVESKHWLTSHAVGTTMPNLNSKILRNFPIELPPLEEQKAITAVLSSLDNKIDLLHRQNKTLEALAQTLFRHWFIDGSDDSWEEVKLQDICTIRRGSSPRPIQKYVENGTVPWIKIADATRSSSLEINITKEFIIEAGVSKSVEVFPGDLILSNSATAGLPFFVGLYGCIHDGWLLFRDFTVPKNFIYFFLHFATAKLNQMADGTVQKNLNTTLLKEYPFKLPSSDLLSEFDKQAELIIKKIKTNNTQIQTLENLRDTLLPKLMSGEVRVRL